MSGVPNSSVGSVLLLAELCQVSTACSQVMNIKTATSASVERAPLSVEVVFAMSAGDAALG